MYILYTISSETPLSLQDLVWGHQGPGKISLSKLQNLKYLISIFSISTKLKINSQKSKKGIIYPSFYEGLEWRGQRNDIPM